MACMTLPIDQKEITEVRLPEAPSEIRLPFQTVDDIQIESVLQSMTLEEKIGQCILWQPNEVDAMAAIDLVKNKKLGGVLFEGMEVDHFMYLTDSLRKISNLPLFIASDEKTALHGQFKGLPRFPNHLSIASIDSEEIQSTLERHYFEQCEALGINLSFRPVFSLRNFETRKGWSSDLYDIEAWTDYHRLEKMAEQSASHRILPAASGFDKFYWPIQDSLASYQLKKYHRHTRNGLEGMVFEPALAVNDSLARMGNEPFAKYLDKILNFNGLSFAKLDAKTVSADWILAGADQIITPDAASTFRDFAFLVNSGRLSQRSLDKRVRKVLKAKSWMNGGRLPVELEKNEAIARNVSFTNFDQSALRKVGEEQSFSKEQIEKVSQYFEHPAWPYYAQTLFEKSVTLTNNNKQTLPFRHLLDRDFSLFEYDGKTYPKFEKMMSKYVDFNLVRHQKLFLGGLPPAQIDTLAEQPVAIVLLDGPRLHEVTDRPFIDGLIRLSKTTDVVLVNFGYPENLSYFPPSISKFQIFERNEHTEEYVAQALFGGVDVGGKLPLTVSDDLPISSSDNIYKMRLSFGTPERNGIAEERLVGINAIAETAIDKRVFPGCQVAVAKGGNVIYSQAFGQHEYGDSRPVKTSDLYDIASITKVASTTLALMKLAGQESIDVNEKLSAYVPESQGKTVGYLRLKNLLTHRSNLQAPMPIGKYFNYRNVPKDGCNNIFCRDSTEHFNVQIASDLFFKQAHQDTIWQKVFNLRLLSRKRNYRYSDVNFYLLQKVVEEKTNQDLDAYTWDKFYRPLGLRHLTYKPLEKVDVNRLVPTERDLLWRKSLVHGYVHDPSAALMGGVGGNAGLFATAEDMAVLFQMMLDDGVYGGTQYLNPGLVKEFATAKYGNHRGLGFDMKNARKVATYSPKASKNTFGHNGFTGTCVWVDPDNDLVYVFLSNRVHPSSNNKKIFSENVRARIHEVVYHAFDSYEGGLPELD